jgi:hypothetical protein
MDVRLASLGLQTKGYNECVEFNDAITCLDHINSVIDIE